MSEQPVHVLGEGRGSGGSHAELVDLQLVSLLRQFEHEVDEVQAFATRTGEAEEALCTDYEGVRVTAASACRSPSSLLSP